MEPQIIQLSGLWIAVMLIYLLGDVLRIFSGDYKKGDMKIEDWGQAAWLGISLLMVTPILLLVITLLAPAELVRPINLAAAVFWFLFNAVGVPTYRGHYDKALLLISMVFNVLTFVVAWNWT